MYLEISRGVEFGLGCTLGYDKMYIERVGKSGIIVPSHHFTRC